MPRQSASGSKPEKNMSSRLLTMKFMQRAAASAAAKESSQAESNSESNASTPKKPRVSIGPDEAATPSSDLEAISAALAAEEDRRRDAVARQAAEAGETEWVLDFGGADIEKQYAQQPRVLADSSLDADDDDVAYGGRQAYGNYKRKNKAKSSSTNSEATGAENESVDLADPEKVQAMIKKERSQRVSLDNLTSISGGRQKTTGGNNQPQKKRKHK